METPLIISEVRKALTEKIDQKTVETGHRVFKEEIKHYGVKIPDVNKVSKDSFQKIRKEDKDTIFSWCELLWQSGYHEEAYVACNWSYYLKDKYELSDLTVFDKWLDRYVSNWATCDTLCNHTVGTFMEMYPHCVDKLKEWALSPNRWVRRGAAVTLIIPARKGMFLKDIFEIAEILLLDKDDLVQKGYGWMLKSASEVYQNEVYDYVLSKKDIMPRTAYRYALEKMPKEMRTKAMAK